MTQKNNTQPKIKTESIKTNEIKPKLKPKPKQINITPNTSDVQIEDSMHSTREEVVEKSIDSVKLVKDAGVECMFSPMDATRTDLTFLGEVVEAVTEVGADWINIPDTCGVATPTRFGDLIRFVKDD